MSVKNGNHLSQASVLSHLIHAVRHNKNSTVRKNAALILGKMGDRKAVDPLIKALGDRVISVRSNAAIALGMLGDKRAVKPLIHRLQAASWQERLNAAISLGWLADPDASHPLLELLYDDHAYVRRGAAFALGQIVNPEMKDVLYELLTDPEAPAYEAAVVLAYMGDLSGYHYLLDLIPHHFPPEKKKKKPQKADEGLQLGNLFYASELFSEAAGEYRRALAAKGKMPARTYRSLLNNLGNALCASGQLETGVIVYLLALRMKSRQGEILTNLERAEILLDIQELVSERLKAWLSGEEAGGLELPAEARSLFDSLSRDMDQKHAGLFLKQFTLGWKSFYALQSYQGEELFSTGTKVPPAFFDEQVSQCRTILLSDPTFRQLHLLLLKLSDEMIRARKEHPPKNLLPVLHDLFAYGYVAGLLQKIWHLSHLEFSLN